MSEKAPTLVEIARAILQEADKTGGNVRSISRYEVDRLRQVLARTKDWEAAARVYREELVRLSNTYALLASSVGGRGKNAHLSKAFAQTAAEANEAVVRGDSQ
jgi:hypothetical protein